MILVKTLIIGTWTAFVYSNIASGFRTCCSWTHGRFRVLGSGLSASGLGDTRTLSYQRIHMHSRSLKLKTPTASLVPSTSNTSASLTNHNQQQKRLCGCICVCTYIHMYMYIVMCVYIYIQGPGEVGPGFVPLKLKF